jgi:predicted CXXCH cytochrome family protein
VKHNLILLFVGISLMMSVTSFGQKFNYGSSMTVAHHKFNTSSWNPTGEICVVCHTPHNADMTVPNEPLWNHEVSAATFTLYSTATFNGAGTAGQPDGNSKLCLSCHDGITIESNFGGITTGTNKFSSTSRLNVGSEVYQGLTAGLSNDHPISFTYDAALASADKGLKDPTTTASGLPGSTGTITTDLLFGGKLQCCSCHDPHNGTSKVLRNTNSGSALCRTCHNF